MLSINCGGTLLSLDTAKIMGILNITPDSFYDGGRHNTEKAYLQQTEKMLAEGADIIDIGAMSSRPNAEIISEQTELDRIIPALRAIVKQFPQALISIDTYRTNVAAQAIAEGATLINDISGGIFDPKLPQYLAPLNIPYIIMHLQGKPQTMHQQNIEGDVFAEVFESLTKKAAQYKQWGMKDVIIDPGFGFGKTISQNYQLLNQLNQFGIANLPILVGISRKSMIYKLLKTTPEQALNGTTALHCIALLKGANILRVHDIKAAKETIQLVKMTQMPMA